MEIAAAAVGFVTAVKTLAGLVRVISSNVRRYQNGPAYVVELSDELDIFKVLLDEVEAFTQDARVARGIETASADLVLERAEQRMLDLQRRIERVMRSSEGDIYRLKWLRTEAACRDLERKLKDCHQELSTTMTLVSAKAQLIERDQFFRLAGELRDPQVLQFSALAVENTDGKAELEISPRRVDSLASSSTLANPTDSASPVLNWRTASVNSITDYGTANSKTVAFTERSATIATVGSVDAYTRAQMDTPRGHQGSLTSVSTSTTAVSLELPARPKARVTLDSIRAGRKKAVVLPDKQRCLDSCACRCHVQSYKWPEGLQGKAGRLFYETAPRFTRRCTDARCRAGKIRSKLTFVYPASMVKKVVSVLMLSRGFKLRFQLKTQRLQPPMAPVCQAVLAGDLKGVRREIHSGAATPSDILADGWTLLHTSSYWGHHEIVQELKNLGADSTIGEVGGRTASDFAKVRALNVNSTAQSKELAKAFPESVYFKINFELTPIHVAVLDEYDADDTERPSLEALLDFVDQANNAPRDTDWKEWRREYRRKSPLYLDIIDAFREASDKSKKSEKTIIHFKDLPDIHGWTPFSWAAFTGRLPALKTLLKHGADPFKITAKGRNTLHQAAESKVPEVVRYVASIPSFEDESIDINLPDYWKETPLHIASSGSAACVKVLLEKGADSNAQQVDQQTPLHYAAWAPPAERLRMVDLLSADRGQHLKALDEDGCTAAFYFVESPDCLALLSERGASLTDTDPAGKTLVHHAAIKDEAATLRMLLGALPGRFATQRDRSGATPMVHALQSGSAACAKLLLEQDAQGDADGADGWHLVHHAARIGDPDFLEAVLQHGSFRRCRKTADGKSSAEVAMQAGTWKGKVMSLLREHDTKVPLMPRTLDEECGEVDDAVATNVLS